MSINLTVVVDVLIVDQTLSQFSIAKLNFYRPWYLLFILPEEDRNTLEAVPVNL